MKKATSKIVMAVIALIIALGLATGTTFAWFSMNTSVSVTGMSVTARSDAVNLVISNAANGTYGTSANAAAASKTVYPVKATLSGTDVSWQVGTSTSPDESMAGVVYETVLESAVIADTDGYALMNKFYVKTTSIQGASNLRIKTCTATGTSAFSTALRVLVVGTTGGEIASNGSVVGTTLASSITTDPIELRVYVYYDGDDSSVITNYVGTLGALSIDLTFEVDDPSA